MNEGSIDCWMKRASAGETRVYHEGHLAMDRMRSNNHDGDKARKLCREGLVFLTQRRIGPRVFEYLCTKAKTQNSELTWNSGYDHW